MTRLHLLCISVLFFVVSQACVAESSHSVFSPIPKLIDATPTLLPEQDNTRYVADIETTKAASWIDRQQYRMRGWVDQRANQVDDWFGQPHPEQPASATLRVLLDQRWDKHDQHDADLRLRGKIKLPTLEKKLSVVFGDDSLDDELNNNVAITDERTDYGDPYLSRGKVRETNSSIALRWSTFTQSLPFDSDLDLGIRSGDDVYARFKLTKDWQLKDDFSLHAEQIYRYGIDSKNYLRSNLELNHQRPQQALFSNQFSIIWSDEQHDDLIWQNFTFRQHQFFYGNRFNYGIYTSGFYEDQNLRLNSWGPFVSWRQPLWREWFYVQTDLNYLNEHREDRRHYLGVLLRLETLF